MLPTMPPAIRCSKSANNGVAAVSRRFERCSHVSFGRPDCLAGHVELELRNVAAKYAFERSYRFLVIHRISKIPRGPWVGQLMSQRGVLCFKSALRLERRDQ